MTTKTFSQLPSKYLLADTDYIVGFTNTNPNGERKWSGATVQNFTEDYIKTQPFAASAWVAFKGDGTDINQNVRIYSSYNIASVKRISNFSYNAAAPYGGNGYRYEITFDPGTMNNGNYVVLGASQVGYLDPNGDDQMIGIVGKATNTTQTCIVAAMDMQARGTNTETSSYISVIFLGGQ